MSLRKELDDLKWNIKADMIRMHPRTGPGNVARMDVPGSLSPAN
ncbi:hypothetical protein CP97_05255 [Aurantiacibacter atlanticus]|uniref:Uncharacterized protein n=1 Tax=Aurantiacibacter atlanticus TaxID=1648404 RepID=A0A0H4VWV3_9SPHN|nr:hypothetical protein CP97_05255 [Aurantiacibacter atlanticus]